MTLKEFAELCGVQIVKCDPGKYGGGFGYQLKDEPRWSCVGLLSEEACYTSWMQDRFGGLASKALMELLAVSQCEAKYHDLMDALRRSRMPHGDCNSSLRYGGKPKACTACMANLRIEEELAAYKGRTIRLA